MTERVLVAYSSKFGATEEVAQTIAGALKSEGVEVDLLRAKEVSEVAPYSAIVVGGSIYAGKWRPDTVRFLTQHRAVLSKVPVAYFTVGLTMSQDTPENRKTALGFLEPVLQALPEIKPVDIGVFGGVNDNRLSLFFRLILRGIKAPKGDFRDWDAIKKWAVEIKPSLLGQTQ